jgi:hypothetical protein
VRKQDGVFVTCEAGHASCIFPKVKSINQSINCSPTPECKKSGEPCSSASVSNSSAGVPSGGEGSGKRRGRRWTEDDDDDNSGLGDTVQYCTVLYRKDRPSFLFVM